VKQGHFRFHSFRGTDRQFLWKTQALGPIIDEGLKARQARESRQERRLVAVSRRFLSADMPAAGDCQAVTRDRAELYLVEGDSAGGSAKQGDRPFQGHPSASRQISCRKGFVL
jgi:DNA gyrase/topoisomerase IV subunit B